MKNSFIYSLFVILFSGFYFVSCKDDEAIEPDKQTAEYTLSVSPDILETFSEQGGEGVITVNATKIIKSYFGDKYDESLDETKPAEFLVSVDNENFIINQQDNQVTITVTSNETAEIRTGVLSISVKRDPSIVVTIPLKQKASPIYGDTYSDYFLDVLPLNLDIFPGEGSTQTINVSATEKQMNYIDGEYVESDFVEIDFNVEIEGEGFTYQINENEVSVTASQNTDGDFRMGNLIISLTEDPTKTYNIPLSQRMDTNFPEDHVFLRLAKYNLGLVSGTFATNHNNDQSCLYTWNEAQDKSIYPAGYRMLTKEEMNKIFPDYKTNGEATYIDLGPKVNYRIIDKTAYRYELVGDFISGNLESAMRVTGRYLENSIVELETISNASWWNSNNQYDIIHYFPANGRNDGTLNNVGMRGHYWVSNEASNPSNAWVMIFSVYDTGLQDGYGKGVRGSIRCIKMLSSEQE